ncbi:MAG: proline--tRNA ligase [Candidatus Omnitrophica bacterium 4484_49]|nr:MAG: proline--tRNA ligase [Candidatus Omnitrophica bacterium 4484_49]
MRYSSAFIPTLREHPKEAEAVSHKLMLRAGMIRRLCSGVYCYLPLGWRVLKKVIQIVREEMDKAGAQEVLLPAIHPLELWEKTGRIHDLGDDMIKFKNRSDKTMALGPTHEEVITWLVAGEVRSYRQLPLILYQIQTKFRDEPRPRFGVIRTCEFIMKDAYSFHTDWDSLEEAYRKMYSAYVRIFERSGLNFLIVEADPGVMGGNVSHEFMALSQYGEDKVVVCRKCDYRTSLEIAERKSPEIEIRKKTFKEIKEVHTPEISSVEDVSRFLNVPPQQLLKTMIYKAEDKFIAALVPGDKEINEVKLRRHLGVKELRMAEPHEIREITGGEVGFSGPLGLSIMKIADYDVKKMSNFVTGANKTNYHLINVNIGRDFEIDEFADIRYLQQGDACPKCGCELEIKNAIEIGHIFKLGTKYSQPLNAMFLDEEGKEHPVIMGCYGIGVNRIIASYIEQNYDDKGILWNRELAPFQFVIIPINMSDEKIKTKAEEIYQFLMEEGCEVLYDDRDLRAGIKFNDAELIGIPEQIIIGDKYLKEGKIELKSRRTRESRFLSGPGDILTSLSAG